ncbi:MAG: hypothetical protein R2741_07940 [Methanolobus sp.]
MERLHFDFCGVTDFHRRIFRTIAGSSENVRIEWLAEVKKVVSASFPHDDV